MTSTKWTAAHLLLAAVLCATVAIATLSVPSTASADGCDITSDSCDSVSSVATLRAHIAAHVPGPWQRSFYARLDNIERGMSSLEQGENANGVFAVMLSYLKMMAAEARQNRENPRHSWRVDFLPILTADIDAVMADACAAVGCGETEE